MTSTLRNLIAAPLLALALAGCKQEQANLPDIESDPSLLRISDCGGLKSYVADIGVEMLLNNHYTMYYRWGVPESDASNGDDGGGDAPSDYTTTNVQEEGVDELDIVKTDGQYIYTVQDRGLHIVKSWPVAESELVATLKLDGWGQGLFLDGDTLYVFSQVYRYDDQSPGTEWLRNWSGTRVEVVDITDRSNPRISRTIEIEGYMADARMIDGNLYGVMNHWMWLDNGLWQIAQTAGLPEVNWELQGEALEEDIATKRAEAAEILRPLVATWSAGLSNDDLLPRFKDSLSGSGDAETLLQCSDLYRPRTTSHYNVLSVIHVGAPEAELNASGIVSDGWTLYASRDNIYVAQTSWWWWWGWGDQKMNTQIHKFNLDESGEPNYTASGVVDGWLYDQWAMSEWDGHLRVTSTDMNWWWGWGWNTEEAPEDPPANNLNVLRDDGAGRLETVGQITGIAPGEQIYATRMMGPKGYMVTFQQVDPLFTIDLSDHENPKILGELKIPGYSAYLHPMGANHLLAVGMAGTEEGQITGLAINVFDVSDMENPALVQAYELESGDSTWSWSEALWDHHAFTWHRDVLTIPAYYYTWHESDGSYDYFSGSISFDATPAGVAEIGRVDHRDLIADSECIYSYWYDYDASSCQSDYWYASLRRTVYIEDNLFTISNYGIKVTDLNDPTVEHARVLFLPRAN